MKTIKVSEAEGQVLDYLVAKCEGLNPSIVGGLVRGIYIVLGPVLDYSSDWAQGGPIIERECIATYASGACSVSPKNPDYWVAEILATDEMITHSGPTPLIAAMRCYVASKLGDTAEVPEELE